MPEIKRVTVHFFLFCLPPSTWDEHTIAFKKMKQFICISTAKSGGFLLSVLGFFGGGGNTCTLKNRYSLWQLWQLQTLKIFIRVTVSAYVQVNRMQLQRKMRQFHLQIHCWAAFCSIKQQTQQHDYTENQNVIWFVEDIKGLKLMKLAENQTLEILLYGT